MTDLAELVHIEDPRFYLNDPSPIVCPTSKRSPRFSITSRSTCLVITKYEDARYITKTHELFSNAHGMFLPDIRLQHEIHEDTGTGSALFPAAGEQIDFTDPPRHRELRRGSRSRRSPAGSSASMQEAVERLQQADREPDRTRDRGRLGGARASLLPARLAALLPGSAGR